MTTQSEGGKITGLLALTCIADGVELAKNDVVHIVGDYLVAKVDGTKPAIGCVSVANVRRDATTGHYPVANVDGDVTVEAWGFEVRTFICGGALTAGTKVAVNETNQKLVASGTANSTDVGILLMTGTGDNDPVDVLCTGD